MTMTAPMLSPHSAREALSARATLDCATGAELRPLHALGAPGDLQALLLEALTDEPQYPELLYRRVQCPPGVPGYACGDLDEYVCAMLAVREALGQLQALGLAVCVVGDAWGEEAPRWALR